MPSGSQEPLIDAVTATPEQIASHVQDAINWTQENRDINTSGTIIIYAWNEYDEGGWLCPTLSPDGSSNSDRLNALSRVLRTHP